MSYSRGLKRSPTFVEKIGTAHIYGGQATFQELWATNATFSGNLAVSGNLTTEGNFTFGDAATDLLSVSGLASFGGSLQVQTSSTTIVTSAAGAYITTSGDEIVILCNSNAQTGAVTYRLRGADSVNGRVLIFKDTGGMAGTATSYITIEPALSTHLIDGLTAVTIKPNIAGIDKAGGYGDLTIVSNGSSWWTI